MLGMVEKTLCWEKRGREKAGAIKGGVARIELS